MTLKNPYKRGGMFEGASNLIFENAKQLRKNMTEAETILWMHLRKGMNGCKFRRQHPIGLYIADFYSHRVKLVVEVDGSVHNNDEVKKNDEARQKELVEWGYVVIRFTNNEVFQKIENVLKKISDTVNQIIQNTTPKIGV
jgi:imidazole glycerol-phosphate synthase subunit HisF